MALAVSSRLAALLPRLSSWLRASPTGSLDVHEANPDEDSFDEPIDVPEIEADGLRSLFDDQWYLRNNADVAASGIDPFHHYVYHGEAEGRDPSSMFSTKFYRATYMYGEALNASPTAHYLSTGRSCGYDPAPEQLNAYALHLFAHEQSYGLEIPELIRHISTMTVRPQFVVFVDSEDQNLRPQIEEKLSTQVYKDWTLCLTKAEVNLFARQTAKKPWFLVWHDPKDELHSSMLYCFASAINAEPDLEALYGDEDEITEDGRRANPFYKPDWSPDYLEACNYLGYGTCVSSAIAEAVLPTSKCIYDFLLKATESPFRISHIRKVLVHRKRGLLIPRTDSEIATDTAAIEARLARTSRTGEVSAVRPRSCCYEVKIHLSSTPLISVVIPTAGRIVDIDGRPVDLIANVLDALQNRSTYKNLEFIVVDNGDIALTRMTALHALGVKTLTYSDPEFNVAKKINLGAAACGGEYLLLMNDDVEPLNPDWIERLLEHFEKPRVGVVGAKLLFPNLTTQHVGVFLNSGNPDHPGTRLPRDHEGYFFSSCATRNFVAVTGAVMLVRASDFLEVGGYTEALAVNYNDADFCLKLQECGLRTVFTPHAELIHYESMSRTPATNRAETEYFHMRWASFAGDPFYNEESLSVDPANYQVYQNVRILG